MGKLTITYPLQYKAVLLQGLRDYLGTDADGLTDLEAAQKALLRFAKGEARRVARRQATSATVAAADRDLASKEIAAQTAVQARKDAEDAEDARVEAAFESEG